MAPLTYTCTYTIEESLLSFDKESIGMIIYIFSSDGNSFLTIIQNRFVFFFLPFLQFSTNVIFSLSHFDYFSYFYRNDFIFTIIISQQVFRRRVGELENLTGEQIEKSRKELADLERKFLERVAQTNRSKTTGGGVVKCTFALKY